VPEDNERLARIVATLKRSAAALRDAGIPFAVAGALATWARAGLWATAMSTWSCVRPTSPVRSPPLREQR